MLLERAERPIEGSRFVERVLVEVVVEGDAESVLGGADGGQDRSLRDLPEHTAIGVGQRLAVLLDQAPRDIADVLPLIPLLGEHGAPADQREVAGADRFGLLGSRRAKMLLKIFVSASQTVRIG